MVNYTLQIEEIAAMPISIIIPVPCTGKVLRTTIRTKEKYVPQKLAEKQERQERRQARQADYKRFKASLQEEEPSFPSKIASWLKRLWSKTSKDTKGSIFSEDKVAMDELSKPRMKLFCPLLCPNHSRTLATFL